MKRAGSPPPMRGKVLRFTQKAYIRRITPAYAGKRIRLMYEGLAPIGSPPPMRGKANNAIFHTSLPRITPAYAGKRNSSIVAPSRFWDHPRLCGEKSFQSSALASGAGSPPPMRGKASINFSVSASTRITPAYAGKRC